MQPPTAGEQRRQSEEASRGNDGIDQLERLGKLKDQGTLSDEEFRSQKAKLLG